MSKFALRPPTTTLLTITFLLFSIPVARGAKILCPYSRANKAKYAHLSGRLEIEIEDGNEISEKDIAQLPSALEEKVFVNDRLKRVARKMCNEAIEKEKGDNFFLEEPQICHNGDEIPIMTKKEFLEESTKRAGEKITEELPASSVLPKTFCLGGKKADKEPTASVDESTGPSAPAKQRDLALAVQEAFQHDRLLVHTTEGDDSLLSLYLRPGLRSADKGKEPFSTTLLPTGTSMNFWKTNGILFDIKDTSKIYESSLGDAQTSERYYNPDKHSEQRKFKSAKAYYDSIKGLNHKEVSDNMLLRYHDPSLRGKMFSYNEVWATHPDQSAIGLFISNTHGLSGESDLKDTKPPTPGGVIPTQEYFRIWQSQQHIKENACQTLPIFVYDAFKKTFSQWTPSDEQLVLFKQMKKESLAQDEVIADIRSGKVASWDDVKRAMEKLPAERREEIVNLGLMEKLVGHLPQNKLSTFKAELEGLLGKGTSQLWREVKQLMIKKGKTTELQRLTTIDHQLVVEEKEMKIAHLNSLDQNRLPQEVLKKFKVQQLSSSEAGKLMDKIELYLKETTAVDKKSSPFYGAAKSLEEYFNTHVDDKTFKKDSQSRDKDMDALMDFLNQNLSVAK